ncbi:unnamed protein product [Arctogadus glacialis]
MNSEKTQGLCCGINLPVSHQYPQIHPPPNPQSHTSTATHSPLKTHRCQSSQIQEESPGVGLGVCHLPLGTALALSLTPTLTPAPETSLASSTCLTPWPDPPCSDPMDSEEGWNNQL